MHISILNTKLRDPEDVSYRLNNMTYSLIKRKKASQLAVMMATPSHAIESVVQLWVIIEALLQGSLSEGGQFFAG